MNNNFESNRKPNQSEIELMQTDELNISDANEFCCTEDKDMNNTNLDELQFIKSPSEKEENKRHENPILEEYKSVYIVTEKDDEYLSDLAHTDVRIYKQSERSMSPEYVFYEEYPRDFLVECEGYLDIDNKIVINNVHQQHCYKRPYFYVEKGKKFRATFSVPTLSEALEFRDMLKETWNTIIRIYLDTCIMMPGGTQRTQLKLEEIDTYIGSVYKNSAEASQNGTESMSTS